MSIPPPPLTLLEKGDTAKLLEACNVLGFSFARTNDHVTLLHPSMHPTTHRTWWDVFLLIAAWRGEIDIYTTCAAVHHSIPYADVALEQRAHFKHLLFGSMHGRPFVLPWTVYQLVEEHVKVQLMLADAQAAHDAGAL